MVHSDTRSPFAKGNTQTREGCGLPRRGLQEPRDTTVTLVKGRLPPEPLRHGKGFREKSSRSGSKFRLGPMVENRLVVKGVPVGSYT